MWGDRQEDCSMGCVYSDVRVRGERGYRGKYTRIIQNKDARNTCHMNNIRDKARTLPKSSCYHTSNSYVKMHKFSTYSSGKKPYSHSVFVQCSSMVRASLFCKTQ